VFAPALLGFRFTTRTLHRSSWVTADSMFIGFFLAGAALGQCIRWALAQLCSGAAVPSRFVHSNFRTTFCDDFKKAVRARPLRKAGAITLRTAGGSGMSNGAQSGCFTDWLGSRLSGDHGEPGKTRRESRPAGRVTLVLTRWVLFGGVKGYDEKRCGAASDKPSSRFWSTFLTSAASLKFFSSTANRAGLLVGICDQVRAFSNSPA